MELLKFCIIHLGSIGLVLDIIGVTILFRVIISIGEQVHVLDIDEQKRRDNIKRKKVVFQWFGYILILVGFVLQLISNEKILTN